MKRNSAIAASLAILFLPSLLLAQEETASAGINLFDLIQQGGWAMWPLGLLSLTMFYLIFHCWNAANKKRFAPAPLINPVCEQLTARNVEQARQALDAKACALSRALSPALAKARPEQADANKEKIELAFVENLEAEEANVGQWINYLNVIATVAPMIGLLGTVWGMIGAFQTIGQGGMGKPELLANDIGMALVTTAAGLVIGIPAMIAYFVMKNRLAAAVLATAQAATLMLDCLSGEIRNPRPQPDKDLEVAASA